MAFRPSPPGLLPGRLQTQQRLCQVRHRPGTLRTDSLGAKAFRGGEGRGRAVGSPRGPLRGRCFFNAVVAQTPHRLRMPKRHVFSERRRSVVSGVATFLVLHQRPSRWSSCSGRSSSSDGVDETEHQNGRLHLLAQGQIMAGWLRRGHTRARNRPHPPPGSSPPRPRTASLARRPRRSPRPSVQDRRRRDEARRVR